MTDALVQTVCDLVAFPSTSDADGGNEADVQAYVAEQFRQAGARVRTFEPADVEGFFEHPLCCGPDRNYKNRPTVVGEVGPEDAPALLIMAHSDVVSINNAPTMWKVTEPFKPVVKAGKIYGRGCADDKWGVACLIHILRKLREDKTPLNKRLVFISTVDEENGVGNGLLLLHLAGITGEAAFYLDGSDEVLTVGNLGGSNLYLHFAEDLSQIALKTIESKLIATCKRISQDRREKFTGLFEANTMHDQSAQARLHESGQMIIHFYTLPGEDGEAFGKELEAAVRETLQSEVDSIDFTYRTPWFEPTVSDADHPFVQGLAASYRNVYNREAPITTVSKQDSFVLRKYGLPTVGFGPSHGRGPGTHHLPDEELSIDKLHHALTFTHRAVCDWLEA